MLKRRAALISLCLFLAGCVGGNPTGHEAVSAGLQLRTGRRLPSELPRGASLANGLTMEEAVTIALCNNALFLETLAELGVARAEVVQAGVVPNPTLTLLFPSGSKQLEFTAKLATEVLWLRPRRLKAAKLDYTRTAEALVQNGLNLIRDVKLAFVDAVAAEQRLRLAEEAAVLSAKIEKLARARVAAGDVSELEAGPAGIDTLQAQEIAGRSQHEVTIARERLRHLLGLGLDRRSFRIVDHGGPPRVPPAVAPLVKQALASRPDLRAAEIAVERAAAGQGLARAEIFQLTAALDANRTTVPTNGGTGDRQRIEAGAGLDVTIPILNQNQGGRARAGAQLAKAARQYATLRDRIILEVREAHVRCLLAQESYGTWHARILPPLVQSVAQAEQAYEVGNVNLLLALENTRRLSDARAREAAAAADLRRATAELERAIGGRVPGR
jgi:cobalt-zinc-cadmium efflux system outer membrane protein